MHKLSTGDDSTLGNYRRLSAAVFGEASAATKFLDGKIAEQHENAYVVAPESQMLYLLGTMASDDLTTKTKGNMHKRKAGAGLAAASSYPFRISKRKDQYSRTVIYAVHGFWSGDNVRVTQSRDHRDGEWESPQINWSCGGRDPGKEPDEIEAAGCFAKAIAAAVKVARKWQKANDRGRR